MDQEPKKIWINVKDSQKIADQLEEIARMETKRNGFVRLTRSDIVRKAFRRLINDYYPLDSQLGIDPDPDPDGAHDND